jgi:uncharacterized membrane protein
MRTVSTWLLGGALLASLSWNWTQHRAARAAPDDGATPACCSLELGDGAMAPEQRARLATICARSCGESDRLEQRADELQRELLSGLSAPAIDRDAVTRLIDEVSELRRRSLASCVEGILGVREVLSPDEVRTLLENCAHGTACRTPSSER